ncbi:MAG TPA: PAS domain S-box protein, partial [Longimicrobiales bacterium]
MDPLDPHIEEGPEDPIAPGSEEASPTSLARAYQAALDALDTAAAIVDLDGRYVFRNRAHREVAGDGDGAPEAEAPADHFQEPTFAEVARRLDATGRYSGEVLCVSPTGAGHPMHLEAFTVGDGEDGPGLRVTLLRDIPDTRDLSPAGTGSENRHEQSVSLLAATLDSTADGILVVDRDGRIVRANRRFAEIWDLPERVLTEGDDEAALAIAVERVRDAEAFLGRVKELYAHPDEESFDTIELVDGRILERYSRPQLLGEDVVGRVWSFRDVTSRARAEEALRASEERYRRLFEESREAIYLTTREGDFEAANRAALELLGYDEGDLRGLNASDLYEDPGQREEFKSAIEAQGTVKDYEVRLKRKDGTVRECLLSATIRREGQAVLGYQGIIQDVTERSQAAEALRASERYYRAITEHAGDTVTILDPEGTIVYESPSVERVLGYPIEELVGQNVFDYVHPDDRPATQREFQTLVASPRDATSLELRFLHRDGSWRTLEAVGSNLLDEPAVGGIVVNARDITQRKEAEDQLLHDAFHDKLTGLPNRALLMDRTDQLLRRGRRSGQPAFSVLFLDLDRFKVVNDSLGHLVGDQLLASLAQRLQASLRPGDTVARFGVDEFAMLLDATTLDEAGTVARRIQADLETPFVLGEHELYTTVSVGIAASTPEHETAQDVLRDADVAMFRAKELGRARAVAFDRSMHDHAVATLHLENDLRRALEREEFVLHYQPIVDLNSHRLEGFEALIRWAHPVRGLLQPQDFLRSADDTGLIVPMGSWVLREVCRQIAEWGLGLNAHRPIRIHVNVSAHQLSGAGLVDRVAAALEEAGIPGRLLHLELTESTMMQNAEAAVVTLKRLKELDVGLAIDDFGTGYSS